MKYIFIRAEPLNKQKFILPGSNFYLSRNYFKPACTKQLIIQSVFCVVYPMSVIKHWEGGGVTSGETDDSDIC